MTTFTSERSQLSLLRALLPTGYGQVSHDADVRERAGAPGQNQLEIYGLAAFTTMFVILWWGELSGSLFWAIPLALVHLHIAAILSAVIGGLWQREGRPRDEGPQIVHSVLLATMALYAIKVSLPLTQYVAAPLFLLLFGNLIAWAARQFRAPLLVITLAHLLLPLLWPLSSPWLAVLALLTLHALIFLDTLYPTASIFGPVQRTFETTEREIWLTIDDGPCHDTEAILELLKAHDAKATFFLIGQRAQKHPDALKAMVAEGHQIGNHTHSHPAKSFWALPSPTLRWEIETAQEVLAGLAGATPTLFRSPVGFANPMLHALLPQKGLKLVGWTARAFDGVGQDPEKALDRLKRDIRPGAILLLHQGRAMNLPLLEALLQWLDDEGFRCVIPNLFEKETARLS